TADAGDDEGVIEQPHLLSGSKMVGPSVERIDDRLVSREGLVSGYEAQAPRKPVVGREIDAEHEVELRGAELGQGRHDDLDPGNFPQLVGEPDREGAAGHGIEDRRAVRLQYEVGPDVDVALEVIV